MKNIRTRPFRLCNCGRSTKQHYHSNRCTEYFARLIEESRHSKFNTWQDQVADEVCVPAQGEL